MATRKYRIMDSNILRQNLERRLNEINELMPPDKQFALNIMLGDTNLSPVDYDKLRNEKARILDILQSMDDEQ